MPGLESLIILLIVGAIAGWLAGVIVKGYGFGLIGNIVIGILGAGIAGILAQSLGLYTASTNYRQLLSFRPRRRPVHSH